MQNGTLIYNIGQLLTMRGYGPGPLCGKDMNHPEVISGGAVYFNEQGIIEDLGASSALFEKYGATAHLVDAGGNMVTPGLVDAHTHLVHAGSREHELGQKLAGVPYLDILKAGGGILSTVRATRKASAGDLYLQAAKSLRRMVSGGVTTVEAKSGYGLNRETELVQLQVLKELASRLPIHVVSTFLGAHAVPPEFQADPDAFVDEMILLLPEIAEKGLAAFCDVFCETGVFTVDQSRRLLQAAKDAGLGLKIHADEIESIGGSRLAAELGATSADHLLAATDEDLEALAKAGVIPVVLPGTSWNLGKAPAQARRMMDQYNLPVAVATDYNPGSCPTENLQLVMAFACHMMKLTPLEVFSAVTRNGAFAAGRGQTAGVIDIGRPADLVLWEANNPEYVVYHFGVNHVDQVWVSGTLAVKEGVALWNSRM